MLVKNYDQSIQVNHNPNWPYIPDHPYRILISDSGSGKTNVSNQNANCLLTEKKK